MTEDLEIIEALLMAQGEPDFSELSDDALVRFALGWIDENEEEETLAALVHSEELRDRLIDTRAAIDKALKQPVGKHEGSQHRAIKFLLRDVLGALKTPQSAMRGAASQTILRALARSVVDRPLLPATVRSGSGSRFSLEPNGPSGTLSIEASSAHSIQLVLQADTGETLGMRPMTVMYDDGSSSVAVAQVLPMGSEASIDLGPLGLAGDRLHPRMFRVVREAEQPRWAETIQAESLAHPVRKFRVRLGVLPRVERERLIVEFIVPEAVALEMESGSVELSILVGSVDMLLATERVPAVEGLVRFEVEAFGVSDGEFSCHEVLSLRFRPNDNPK